MMTSASAQLPTSLGNFIIHSFENKLSPYNPHLALISNRFESGQVPLIRIHSECLTGDVFGSLRCDCAYQLHTSMSILTDDPGILIYLRQEGRGIGLHSKIQAYQKQDQGFDTVEANLLLGYEADERDYNKAAEILRHFQINSLRLLSNNPIKARALIDFGFNVTEMIPIIAPLTSDNKEYLKTKKEKLGHIFPNS